MIAFRINAVNRKDTQKGDAKFWMGNVAGFPGGLRHPISMARAGTPELKLEKVSKKDQEGLRRPEGRLNATCPSFGGP